MRNILQISVRRLEGSQREKNRTVRSSECCCKERSWWEDFLPRPEVAYRTRMICTNTWRRSRLRRQKTEWEPELWILGMLNQLRSMSILSIDAYGGRRTSELFEGSRRQLSRRCWVLRRISWWFSCPRKLRWCGVLGGLWKEILIL